MESPQGSGYFSVLSKLGGEVLQTWLLRVLLLQQVRNPWIPIRNTHIKQTYNISLFVLFTITH